MDTTSHYDKVLGQLSAGKDSIFEPCKIVNYNPETMLAEVYFISSRQQREDVLVLFPSIYVNTGIISPPVKDSTGLAFWGPDRQAFVLPTQYNMPQSSVENRVVKFNASPGQINESLGLANVESGEQLIRSLGGAYVFTKNTGEVEIGTPSLNNLTMSDIDGSLSFVFDRVVKVIGGTKTYKGPYITKSTKKDTTSNHLSFEINELVPDIDVGMKDYELIDFIVGSSTGSSRDIKSFKNGRVVLSGQIGNVYDGADQRVRNELEEELVFQALTEKGKIEVSKYGTFGVFVGEPDEEQGIQITKEDIEITLDGEVYSMKDVIASVYKDQE